MTPNSQQYHHLAIAGSDHLFFKPHPPIPSRQQCRYSSISDRNVINEKNEKNEILRNVKQNSKQRKISTNFGFDTKLIEKEKIVPNQSIDSINRDRTQFNKNCNNPIVCNNNLTKRKFAHFELEQSKSHIWSTMQQKRGTIARTNAAIASGLQKRLSTPICSVPPSNNQPPHDKNATKLTTNPNSINTINPNPTIHANGTHAQTANPPPSTPSKISPNANITSIASVNHRREIEQKTNAQTPKIQIIQRERMTANSSEVEKANNDVSPIPFPPFGKKKRSRDEMELDDTESEDTKSENITTPDPIKKKQKLNSTDSISKPGNIMQQLFNNGLSATAGGENTNNKEPTQDDEDEDNDLSLNKSNISTDSETGDITMDNKNDKPSEPKENKNNGTGNFAINLPVSPFTIAAGINTPNQNETNQPSLPKISPPLIAISAAMASKASSVIILDINDGFLDKIPITSNIIGTATISTPEFKDHTIDDLRAKSQDKKGEIISKNTELIRRYKAKKVEATNIFNKKQKAIDLYKGRAKTNEGKLKEKIKSYDELYSKCEEVIAEREEYKKEKEQI